MTSRERAKAICTRRHEHGHDAQCYHCDEIAAAIDAAVTEERRSIVDRVAHELDLASGFSWKSEVLWQRVCDALDEIRARSAKPTKQADREPGEGER